ncbi:MAG: META domain-containing protein [Chitinophagaceae bacterium]|jgi:heat shock protein HslJ|nr:META domain-containing protein [Chitinophagaceae bacterium]
MKLIILSFISAMVFACSPKLTPDHSWGDKRWVLYEMKGVPVQLSGTDKDASLQFNATEKKYYGSGGCNRLNGIYTINKKESISFGNAASTMMNCVDQAFEDMFIATLKTVDGYTLENNSLLLKSGKNIVLRFR